MMTLVFAVAIPIVIGVIGYYLVRTSRDLSWGLLAIVFFMPFERLPSVPVAGLTLKTNHILGASLIVLWILAIVLGRLKIKPNILTFPLLAMLGSFAVSTFFAEARTRSLTVWLSTCFTVLLSLVIAQSIKDKKFLKILLTVLGITTVISIIFGLYQFAGDMVGLPSYITGLIPGYGKAVLGFPRIQAFSQEPLYLGNFLLVPLGIALAFLGSTKQTWFNRATLLWFIVLGGLAFALTLSRGAFIGLACTAFVIFLLQWKQYLRPKILTTIFIGIVLAIIGTAGVLAVLGPKAQETFVDHLLVKDYGQGDSTMGRLMSWQQAYQLWETSPTWGIGPGNFGPATLHYPINRPVSGWPIVNNEYLELLAETGLVGSIIFLICLFIIFFRSAAAIIITKEEPELQAILIGLSAAFLGILAQYNFFSTLYINPIWIAIGLLMGVQILAFKINGQKMGRQNE